MTELYAVSCLRGARPGGVSAMVLGGGVDNQTIAVHPGKADMFSVGHCCACVEL